MRRSLAMVWVRGSATAAVLPVASRVCARPTVRVRFRWLHFLALFVPMFVMATSASAQPVPEPYEESFFSGLSILVDEDTLLPFGFSTDRNYTGGFGLRMHGLIDRWTPTFWVREGVDYVLSLGLSKIGVGTVRPDATRGENIVVHSTMIVGSGFTPDDILDPDPIPEDRPYAGLALLSSRRHFVRGATEQWSVGTELGLGLVGSGIPPAIQRAIHSEENDPQGWDHQISDGGDLAAYYRVDLRRRIGARPTPGDYQGGELVWETLEAWVGHYDNVASGVSMRLGRFYSPFWSFNAVPLGGVAQVLAPPLSSNLQAAGNNQCQCRKDVEFFLFGAAKLRWVIYNGMLQGWDPFTSPDNPVEFSAGEVSNILLETQIGAHLGIRFWSDNYLTLTYLANRRSSEFNSDLSRAHWWGSIHLSVAKAIS